jgi:hypothetical protein
VTVSSRRVLQIRLVVRADDFEDAVRCYRNVPGAAVTLRWRAPPKSRAA